MARIDEYSFGRIVVDGREHTKDLIILPGRIVTNWWRADGHSLISDDLAGVIDELPSHLVLGTGANGRLEPRREAIEDLEGRGISVEVMPTTDAVLRYKELDPSHAAAALHLTC